MLPLRSTTECRCQAATAVHSWAAKENHLQVATKLIELGVDVNEQQPATGQLSAQARPPLLSLPWASPISPSLGPPLLHPPWPIL